MRTTKARTQASLVAASLTFLVPLSATAQAPQGEGDKVTAQALFDAARKLVAEGNLAEACPKFADSQRLDPSPSTLLNLASCWEKLGHTAAAWATYKEAESAASAAKRQDYVAVAQRHADALAPKLSRLTITVATPIAGMSLTRDGVEVAQAQWGVPIPVDRGQHQLEATAPGFKGWAAKVDVAQEAAQVSVTVPPLEALPAGEQNPVAPSPPTATSPPAAPAAAASPPETRPAGSPLRTIGLFVAGAGVVGLGVSGALALVANGKNQDSLRYCSSNDPSRCFDQRGVSLRNDALTLGDAATVAFVIGAVALAGGAVVWLTAPRPAEARADSAVHVALGVRPGGALVEGTWP